MDNNVYEVHPIIAREAGIAPVQYINEPEPEPVIEQQEPAQEQQFTPQEPEESFEELQARDKQFRAFKELREARDRAERERDDLQRRIAESQQSRASQVEDDLTDVLGGGDDDLIERKHLKKIYSSFERKFEQRYKQAEERALEAQIRSRYPDFDAVVTSDRIAQLRKEYPEIAQSLSTSTDEYNKALSVYKMIKQFGYDKDPNAQEMEYTKQRVQSNAVRPKTATSISAQRPSSGLQQADAFARGLTPELQKQLYKEMIDAMKQR